MKISNPKYFILECEADFCKCNNNLCMLFNECKKYREMHRRDFLSDDDVSDEKLRYVAGRMLTKLAGYLEEVLTDEQYGRMFKMPRGDRTKFQRRLQDRIIEMVVKDIQSERDGTKWVAKK